MTDHIAAVQESKSFSFDDALDAIYEEGRPKPTPGAPALLDPPITNTIEEPLPPYDWSAGDALKRSNDRLAGATEEGTLDNADARTEVAAPAPTTAPEPDAAEKRQAALLEEIARLEKQHQERQVEEIAPARAIIGYSQDGWPIFNRPPLPGEQVRVREEPDARRPEPLRDDVEDSFTRGIPMTEHEERLDRELRARVRELEELKRFRDEVAPMVATWKEAKDARARTAVMDSIEQQAAARHPDVFGKDAPTRRDALNRLKVRFYEGDQRSIDLCAAQVALEVVTDRDEELRRYYTGKLGSAQAPGVGSGTGGSPSSSKPTAARRRLTGEDLLNDRVLDSIHSELKGVTHFDLSAAAIGR